MNSIKENLLSLFNFIEYFFKISLCNYSEINLICTEQKKLNFIIILFKGNKEERKYTKNINPHITGSND